MLIPQSSAAVPLSHPVIMINSELSHNGRIALAYVRAGYFVFPCAPTREKHKPTDRLPFGKATKKPLVEWADEATKDEGKIGQWWRQWPDALVALPCKQNRLLVIDADRHTAEQDGIAEFDMLCEGCDEPMPPHPVTKTDYEGRHHIFAMPDPPIPARPNIAAGIETRGYKLENSGSYFIGAGSLMPDGRRWARLKGTPLLVDGPPPLPPQWLIELCRPQQKQEAEPVVIPFKPSGKNEEAYALSTLNRVASELSAKRANTGRDNLLVSVAGTMGTMIKAGWVGYSTVEGRLVDACKSNGLLQEIGEAKVRDKIKRSAEAVTAHQPLKERPAIKGNGKDDSAIKKTAEPLHSWDDPDISLLDDRRGDLPDFPLHVFSENLQEIIKRNARGAGVTPAHVAVPLIGITSGVIGYARRVRISKAWLQSCTCWTVVIGYSGTGKTPGLNVVKRALREIERLGKENEAKRQREHETKNAKAKATHDKWKKEVEKAIEDGTSAPLMPPEAIDPGKYVPLKIFVADGTVERLTELLQARQHGIILLRDELSALFMNMSRYSGGQDNEFWLECWNGDFFNVERMGRNGDIDHLLIGMVGGMQPDKLVRSFEGDHDGQYARVLFAWPNEPTWQGLNDDADEIDADLQNVLSRINKLAEYADGRLVKLVIPLDAEARMEFAQFAQFAHREKYTFDGREREWFAKVTAHAMRLAGTITYLEWALSLNPDKPEAITKATISAAITLVLDYFWPHARACLRQIGLTEKHANARRALFWTRAKDKQAVSLEDIRRDALSQRLDAKETTDLLTGLCGSGWLREEITPPGPQGGKPVRRWLVNPILFTDPVAETALTAETLP
jgi:hypothetical protein